MWRTKLGWAHRNVSIQFKARRRKFPSSAGHLIHDVALTSAFKNIPGNGTKLALLKQVSVIIETVNHLKFPTKKSGPTYKDGARNLLRLLKARVGTRSEIHACIQANFATAVRRETDAALTGIARRFAGLWAPELAGKGAG